MFRESHVPRNGPIQKRAKLCLLSPEPWIKFRPGRRRSLLISRPSPWGAGAYRGVQLDSRQPSPTSVWRARYEGDALFSVVCALLLSGCGTGSLSTAQGNDPSRFTYTRVYAGRGIALSECDRGSPQDQLRAPAPPIHVSGSVPATGAFLGAFEPRWGTQDLENRLNHPVPAVQFVTVLQGVLSLITTDGETRRFRAGDVVRVEDIAPCKGHIAVWGDQPGYLMFAR
jgi:hypothetical protein